MSFPGRKEIVIDEKEAVSLIQDGMSVAFGGLLTSSHPMALTRQIIKKGVKGLTVIGSQLASVDIDLLIGAGCAKKIITGYVGLENYAPIGPFYRWAAERGEIDIWECEEGIYYAGLRAAAQVLPFAPWRGGVGTSFPELNPDIKVFKDPIKGEPLLAIPPIKPDIFIAHAAFADRFGNVQHMGTGFGDRTLARAADRTIVQVERIVSNETIRKNPAATTIPYPDAIVYAPFGAHPFASPGFYREDFTHLKEYVDAATAFTKDGDRKPFDRYLNQYIFEPDSHVDYLERIGIKRIIPLIEA